MNKRKQIVITKINNNTVCTYMHGNDIYDAVIDTPHQTAASPAVGDIYLGKVVKVVSNISAAFVDIGYEKLGYLALKGTAINDMRPEREVIVQVKKPEKGDKDAVLTTNLSLVGRYSVIESDGLTITNTIRRTNAAYVDESIFTLESDTLKNTMLDIIEHGHQRTAKSLLYIEPPFYIREINSYHADELDRVITDVPEIYDYLTRCFGGDVTLELYDDSYSIDSLYGISTQLNKALERRVWLKSGASIVVDRTEAATVIDVNTSKAIIGNSAKEDTFLKINLEAADEIARQLRIRQISGIILVDFIDMKKQANYDSLVRHLRDILKNDPVKASFIDMTKLGIVEITRTKRHTSIYDAFLSKH